MLTYKEVLHLGYSLHQNNPIVSCLVDQINKMSPENEEMTVESLIEDIKITKGRKIS